MQSRLMQELGASWHEDEPATSWGWGTAGPGLGALGSWWREQHDFHLKVSPVGMADGDWPPGRWVTCIVLPARAFTGQQGVW